MFVLSRLSHDEDKTLVVLLTISSSRARRIIIDAKGVFVQSIMIKQSMCERYNIRAKGNMTRRVEHDKNLVIKSSTVGVRGKLLQLHLVVEISLVIQRNCITTDCKEAKPWGIRD